jgi:hypothetical protein
MRNYSTPALRANDFRLLTTPTEGSGLFAIRNLYMTQNVNSLKLNELHFVVSFVVHVFLVTKAWTPGSRLRAGALRCAGTKNHPDRYRETRGVIITET